MTTGTTIQFDDTSFAEAIGSGKPVLVDFWAEWCAPCRALGPTIDKVAESVGDDALVGKLNVDDSRQLARDYKVTSIPTIIIFKDGEEVNRLVGLQSEDALADAIREAS